MSTTSKPDYGAIEEQIAQAMKSAQDALQKHMKDIEEQTKNIAAALDENGEEEGLKVDGISSSFAAPEPVEREFQDQTAVEIDIDTIDDLDDLSMTVLRPEILARFDGSRGQPFRGQGFGGRNFRDLLEANILRDQLADDVYKKVYDHILENNPKEIEAATERVTSLYEKIDLEVEVLVAYRSMIDQALSSLDLHESGVELGQLMLDGVEEIIQDEDTLIENLPSNLEDFINTALRVKYDIDEKFSNSKLFFALMAIVYEHTTGYGSHMTRGTYPVGTFNFYCFPRSKYSLAKFKSDQIRQTRRGRDTVAVKGYRSAAATINKNNLMQELSQLLSCLSNELIISGGINRLTGTELGIKYGSTGENPLRSVFGTEMSQIYSRNFRITDINSKKGSLTDFITAEDVDSSRVVLPFEVTDIVIGNKKFLAGSSYMVEGPARKIDKGFENPLRSFSKNLEGEAKSASSYFTELMALDESTLLAPQSILVRVLEDILLLCQEASKPKEEVDFNFIRSAAKVWLSDQTATVRTSDDKRLGRRGHVMCAGDLRFMLQKVMSEDEQPEYRLEVDPVVKRECEYSSTKKQFGNKLESYVEEYWNVTGRLNPRSGAGKSTRNVIPIGHRSSKFNIDAEGEIPTVHRMIMTLTDEIMAEADSFAKRKGSEASIKNDAGFTRYSNLDYSFILATVYQIYHVLIKEFFHWECLRFHTSGNSMYNKTVFMDSKKNKEAAAAITSLLTAFKDGTDFDDLFDESGNALAAEGTSFSSRIGKSQTFGQLLGAIESLRNHRTYLKCAVAGISAIQKNIVQKSTPLMTFQSSASEVLSGRVKLANVKNDKLAAFVRLVQQPLGVEALRGLTSMQVNNTKAALERMRPEQETESRQKRYVMSPGMVEALRIFQSSRQIRSMQNIVCVGLPNGMIDNLRSSTVSISKRENESSDLGKIFIRFTADNELHSSIEFTDVEVPFDSSLYIMPDSFDLLSTDEDEEENESRQKASNPFDDLVNKTVFYRMESGKVVERLTGEELIERDGDQTREILENHIFSELTRVSIDAALGINIHEADFKKYSSLNSSHVSSEGLSLIKAISKIKGEYLFRGNSSLISRTMSPVEIDEITEFNEMLGNYVGYRSFRLLGDKTTNDIKRAGQSSLYTAELDRHRIIGTSTFDRVFYVPISNYSFRLDYRQGSRLERNSYLGRGYGRRRLSYRRFDLTGYVCDVRVN